MLLLSVLGAWIVAVSPSRDPLVLVSLAAAFGPSFILGLRALKTSRKWGFALVLGPGILGAVFYGCVMSQAAFGLIYVWMLIPSLAIWSGIVSFVFRRRGDVSWE